MIGTAARWIGKGAGRGARIAGRGARRTGRVVRQRGGGKALVGASIGVGAVAGGMSETMNPDGYAGDVTRDLTGSRNFQSQMFGASIRNEFTASQPRMGRPTRGRRPVQAPPGDIVFGMYNLR